MARQNLNSQYVLDVDAALVRQEIANNRSLYHGRVYLDRLSGSGYWSAGGTAYSVSGPMGTYSGNDMGYDFRNGVTRQVVWQGEFWVGHSADGSHPGFNFSGSRSMANPPGGSASVTVPVRPPTIPRASTATFAGGATITAGAAVTINTNRAAAGFTHDITWKFGSATGTIATGVGASVSWTPPLTALQQIPSTTSGRGHVTVVTKSGSTTVGTTTTAFTLTAPASLVPTVSSLTTSDATALVSQVAGTFVQGLSVLTATVHAAGIQGSTIAASAFSVGNSSVPSGGKIPLTTSGATVVTGTATDSRGRVGTRTQTIQVLPYAPPTVNSCVVRRANSSGAANDNGAYLSLQLDAAVQSLVNGTQRNAMTVRVYTRQKGATTWTARNTITPGLTHKATVLISGGAAYAVERSWEVRVEVADKFMTSAVQTIVATASVFMHWARGLGVGKFWEQGAIDANGDIFHRGGSLVEPLGIMHEYAGTTAPAGWLLCQGQAVSRAAYAGLFSVVGTTYGTGDGSTTFNLPDRRGRVAVGLDAGQGEFNALGKTGGAKAHTLTNDELPRWINLVATNTAAGGAGTNDNGGNSFAAGQATGRYRRDIGNETGGNAHNNLQPYITLNYIIKAL